MSENRKLFWLGKGTLGDIKTGDEIPVDYITKGRLIDFEKKGLIGEKIVATVEHDSEKDLEIKDLKAQKRTLTKKLSRAEKEISKLESSFKKVSDEKDKLIKAAKAHVKTNIGKDDGSKKEPDVKVSPADGKAGPK